MSNPYHHVSVSSAIALARLGGVLHLRSKDYEIKEAPETSLTDIRSRSLILVGAMNNQWTMRLLKPLRIHFTFDNSVARIQDSEIPVNRAGLSISQSRTAPSPPTTPSSRAFTTLLRRGRCW